MNGTSIILSLTVANFIWQALTGHQWDAATERSFFQAAAVFITIRHYKREAP